jgi:hypothetical protein
VTCSNKFNGVQVRKKSAIWGIPGGVLRKKVNMATESHGEKQDILYSTFYHRTVTAWQDR